MTATPGAPIGLRLEDRHEAVGSAAVTPASVGSDGVTADLPQDPGARARRFTFRGALPPSATALACAILVIPTGVLHVLLVADHPVIAWLTTFLSLLLLMWLLVDYGRVRSGAVLLDDSALSVSVGLRIEARVPRESIRLATDVTRRAVATSGAAYMNAMQPAEPNVLLTLGEPVGVRFLGFAEQRVSILGLYVDDPDAFLSALIR